MNQFTADVRGFSPVDHHNHVIVVSQRHMTLVQGPYEKVMEHSSFLIEKNASLTVKGYYQRGIISEVFLVSQ